LLGQRCGGLVARLVAVVGNQNSARAVRLERGQVVGRETSHAIAGRDVVQACLPERERIDQRLAQDDFLELCQRGYVPHALVRARQVQVQRRAGTRVVAQLAAVHLGHIAVTVDHRNHDRTIKVLMSRRAQDADPLQAPLDVRAGLDVLRWQPVAQRASLSNPLIAGT